MVYSIGEMHSISCMAVVVGDGGVGWRVAIAGDEQENKGGKVSFLCLGNSEDVINHTCVCLWPTRTKKERDSRALACGRTTVRPVPASRTCRYEESCRGGRTQGEVRGGRPVVMFFLGLSGLSWSFDGTLRDVSGSNVHGLYYITKKTNAISRTFWRRKYCPRLWV